MEDFRKTKPRKYSIAFIMEVINEVQSGRISMNRAQVKYGIGGNTTISEWIEKYSKLKVKKRQQMDEVSRLELEIEKLKKEKQELESALSQSYLEILTLKNLVEVYQEDDKSKSEKKSTGKEQSQNVLKKALGLQEDTQ